MGSLWLAVLLAGCAAQPITPVEQHVEVSQYPAPGGSPGQLATFTGSDDAELAYLSYTSTGARTALVYLHGIESHAGWFAMAGPQLREQGFDVYCLDRRGSGLNRENRGFLSGHVENFETLIADIHAFISPLRDRYDNVFLVGLSWGGKLALSYGLSHPEDIDGLVLITPGLRAKADVSFLNKLKIALDYIKDDSLRLSSATVRFFWQSHRLDKFVDRNISTNRLPIQLFLAGQDTIIDNDGVLKVLAKGQHAIPDVLGYDDQTHSIQLDASQRLVDDMSSWIKQNSKLP
jgi:alpha-beta hydrolase superfamily lysophospholipase